MGGRNIVLLSDGTGNSAATTTKTNVWRLYKALRLDTHKQLAAYDDGVGTSGPTVLRALGGGVGLGLARNVRDLYTYLCEHYQKEDKIYVFGFSRGAFTARTVAGMIVTCGILDRSRSIRTSALSTAELATDDGLKAGVKVVYRSYRRSYDLAGLANVGSALRDLYFHTPDPSDLPNLGQAEIEFIGVWDTVDAVGLPVDELSVVADRFVAPHRFPDQKLSEHVKRAVHAVAIDDERHTFHPVMWDESSPKDQERIRQVWFAGMHANVGGGYPDDDLSYVPLLWMIEEARKAGLEFDPGEVDRIRLRANPYGKMHDSRAGAGVYYRYQPRRIEDICNNRGARSDGKDSVFVERPKIHHTVFDRIRENVQGYAPAGLPSDFDIVGPNGNAEPAPDELKPDHALLDRAQSHIWWRRRFYFFFVFLTFSLLAFPHFFPPTPGLELSSLQVPVGFLLGFLSNFLPVFAEHWFESWTQAPVPFLTLMLAYAWAWVQSFKIARNALRQSEVGWWHVRARQTPRPDASDIGFFERWAEKMRYHAGFQKASDVAIRRLVPPLVALVCLAILGGVFARVFVYWPGARGGLCAKELDGHTLSKSALEPIDFETRCPCFDTGVELIEGQTYKLEIETTGWLDRQTPAQVDGIVGFATRFQPAFLAAFPLRRHLSLNWFALTGEIGRDSGNVFPIAMPRKGGNSIKFRSPGTGRLYLYVNDAILGAPRVVDKWLDAPDWRYFYNNNKGKARIVIAASDH